MLEWRTLALGAGVFVATFAGGWAIGLGKSSNAFTPAGADASPTLVSAPATPAIAGWPPGSGLTDNELLRRSVVLRGHAFRYPACDSDSRTLYLIAATNYAEVLMRTAGCQNFPICPVSEAELDRVWQARRSILDRPVAEAMLAVHTAGGLKPRDFQGGVATALRVIAGADLPGGPLPDCVRSSNPSKSGWQPEPRR